MKEKSIFKDFWSEMCWKNREQQRIEQGLAPNPINQQKKKGAEMEVRDSGRRADARPKSMRGGSCKQEVIAGVQGHSKALRRHGGEFGQERLRGI